MFIYKITNQLNGKIYIGYNKSDADHRWHEHKKNYLKEEFSAKYLYRAMNKDGIDNFKYERIEDDITDFDLLKEREVVWVDHYKSNDPVFGYNMTKGGDGGCGNKTFLESASKEELEEYSKKISESKKEFFNDPKTEKNGQKDRKN
jgi:group I intron endonuclease